MTTIANIPTNHIIKIINHAKNSDHYFSVSGPASNQENKEILPGKLEIQVTSHIDTELDRFDGAISNIKNQPLSNFLKHLKKRNATYNISVNGAYAMAKVNIPIIDKKQCMAIMEAAFDNEAELVELLAAETDEDDNDYDYEPDPDDR